jgi:hypothetical protein
MIAGARIYPVFDLITSQERMRSILDAVALYWGHTGIIKLIGHGGNLFSKR